MTYDQWKCRSPDDDLPEFEEWEDCPECGGEGEILETIHVYERGCGFSHPDTYGRPCRACGGRRGSIVPAGTSNGITIDDLDDRCGPELDHAIPF
jgi:hypothetical protein